MSLYYYCIFYKKKNNKSQIYFRIADHIYRVSDSLQFTHEPQQQSKKQKHNKG